MSMDITRAPYRLKTATSFVTAQLTLKAKWLSEQMSLQTLFTLVTSLTCRHARNIVRQLTDKRCVINLLYFKIGLADIWKQVLMNCNCYSEGIEWSSRSSALSPHLIVSRWPQEIQSSASNCTPRHWHRQRRYQGRWWTWSVLSHWVTLSFA